LLTAVVGGATVVVVAAVVQFTVDMEGAWLLAPGPPCERVLTVAGDRCWSAGSFLFPPLQ
jgi:hypothetical protein